jgi:hypothetical protein
MIRMRVLKKWMDQDNKPDQSKTKVECDNKQDESKTQVECFINICLLVKQIQEICSEICVTGHINPLNRAFIEYAQKRGKEKL